LKRIVILSAIIVSVAVLSRIIFPFNLISNQFPEALNIDPQLPNVLLIGDSTQIRYYPLVKKTLKGKANVYRIVELAPQQIYSLFYGGPLLQPVNGSSSGVGRKNLDEWLGNKQWAVIHFNWGIHNLIKSDDAKKSSLLMQTAIRNYRDDLEVIIDKLENSGAKLVFATTTPVSPEAGYVPDMVEHLNQVATTLAAKHGISVDDLYSLLLPKLEIAQEKDHIHFNALGNEILASAVSSAIMAALRQRSKGGHPG
jgi:hypothetical protein